MTTSTYQLDVTLGAYSFTLNGGDAYDPADQVYLLDGMSMGWSNTEGDLRPAQPNPSDGSIQLLARNASDLAGLTRGDTAVLKLTSAGTLIGRLTGRIGQPMAKPVRRKGVQYLRYDIKIVDYVVDLADTKITLTRVAENWGPRLTAIAAAAAAKLGVPVNIGVVGGGAGVDALNAADTAASALILESLRTVDLGNAGLILTAKTTAGVLTEFRTTNSLSKSAVTWPSGLFAMVGGLLKLTFGGAPPAVPGAVPLSLRIPSSRIDEDVSYIGSKFSDPNTLLVTGPFGTLSFRYPNDVGADAVTATIPTNLTDAAAAEIVGRKYLPYEASANTWDIEGVTWRPTDAQLAAMPFPLLPDSDTENYACLQTSLVIDPVANKINPSTDSGFYGGSLDGATVRIVKGRVLVDLLVSRQIPMPDPVAAVVGITPNDIAAASYAAVTPNQVDPTLSVYETRLARKP